jgi:hypothetical protein
MHVRLAIPILLLLSLAPFYWTSFHAPAVGTIHDDGIYLVTAKALAEGKGYRIISLPSEPKQTKYPIVFPFLLALVWKAFPHFPGNIPVLKLVPLLSWVAWIGIGMWFARRWGRLSWEATLWIAFFCAATRWAIFVGTNFMSDLLFGALALAAIHFLLSMETSPHPVRTAAIAGLLCTAAYGVRTAGIAVIVGGVVTLLRRRDRRPALLFAGIALTAMALWTVWLHGGAVFSNPIEAYYTSQNYADWNLFTAGYPGLTKVWVFLSNIFYVLVFPPQIVISNSAFVSSWIAAILGATVWVFYFRGMRASRELRPAHICLAVYVGLVLFWAWPPDRFLTSLLPLFAIPVCKGLPQRFRNYYAAVLPICAVLAGGWGIMQYTRASGIPWVTDDRHLDWTELSTLHQWIARTSDPSSVVMANFDPAVFLYTGRKAIRPYELDNLALSYGIQQDPAVRESAFHNAMKQNSVRYVLRSSSDPEEWDLANWIARARMRDGAALAPVVALPNGYQIYRVQPNAASLTLTSKTKVPSSP